MITSAEIRALVPGPCPLILDVGCHDGEQTAEFLALYPEAHVHCFEPDPRAIAKFLARFGEGTSPWPYLHGCAIAAEDGTREFWQSGGSLSGAGDWDLSGSLLAPKGHLTVHPWCSFERKIEVPAMSLDSFGSAYGVGNVDFLWADVQGAEGEMIRGGAQLLARTRYLYTEYNDGELYEGQPTLAALCEMLPGFRLAHRYENDALFANVEMAR